MKTNILGRRLVVLLTVFMLMAGLFIVPETAGAATEKKTTKPAITITSKMEYPPDRIAKGSKVHLGGVVRASRNSYIYQVRARIINRKTGDTAMLKVWRPKGKSKPVTVNIARTINKLVTFAKLPKGDYTISMYVFARNKKGGKTVSKRVMHKGFSII